MNLQRRKLAAVLGALLLFAPLDTTTATQKGTARRFVIVAVNDVYRIEGVDQGQRGGLARLRSLRVELEREYPDLLMLHAGDLLFPSLLSRLYKGKQMVEVLNRLDGSDAFDNRMLVTFGNHEFEAKDAATLDRRIEESQFRWLGSNVEFARGVEAENLVPHAIVKSGGVRVGVFGLTIDSKSADYVVAFHRPEQVARQMSGELRRKGAEVVVALTHLMVGQDMAILRNLGPDGPDLIIGGHEHKRNAEEVDGRLVLKADADARTATIVRVTLRADAPPKVRYQFRHLGPISPPLDTQVQAFIEQWLERHDREYCRKRDKKPGCLAEPLGKTLVTLIGEELAIRKFETNLGNWIVDQALAAFRDQGAQAAFINSGALRLNQNIAAGTDLTRRHIEELLPYPNSLKLLRIDGATMQRVVSRAVENWTGEGHWLQISGFAFRHDPETQTADRLTLLANNGPRSIKPDETVLVVTNEFLVDSSKGYTFLNRNHVISEDGPELRSLVIAALKASGDKGIAPEVEGRICNTQKVKTCLAVMGPVRNGGRAPQ